MGGANRAMLYLILELKKLGIDSEVVLPKTKILPNDYLGNELTRNNIKFYTEYYFFYRINCRNGLIRYLSNFVWYLKILWKLKGKKYSLIHSNSSFTDLGIWISIIKKIPHVWHLREYGNWGNSVPALGKSFDWFLASHTTKAIAISNAESLFYIPLFPKNRIKVIYDGVEPRNISDKYNKLLDNYDCQANKYKFCIVGTLCDGKNQIMAIEAAGLLHSKRKDFEIYIIGSGEEYEKKLRKRAIELNIESIVKFLGEVNNVDYWLDQMQCGLMLTQNEAFGRVTIEYMLHALPVIATDSGANPEIIKNGETGIIVGQNDIPALYHSMNFMMDNKLLTNIWGKEGKKRALNEFSSHSNAMAIKSLYESLI